MNENANLPVVSFDFDGTLSESEVQNFAFDLIKLGYPVRVVTARYDDNHAHRWPNNPNNDDLYQVTEKLGIPKHHIRFCNMEPKVDYLRYSNIMVHLDDLATELIPIIQDLECATIAVDVKDENWKDLIVKAISDSTLLALSGNGRGFTHQYSTDVAE